jgi:hypothetical protein
MKQKRLILVMALFCLLLSKCAIAQTDSLCAFDFEMMSDSGNVARQQHLQNILKFRSTQTINVLPNGKTFGQNQTSGLYSCRAAQYIVPVVVHVVHLPSDSVPGMGSNISDEQIESALRALNADFANDANTASPAINTGIQFCLAKYMPDGTPFNGITRTSTLLSNHRYPIERDTLRTINSYDPQRYLNIWVVKNILDNAGMGGTAGVQGYASLPGPGRQGIVMRAQRFGNENDCSNCYLYYGVRGAVLTHEVGHYLGLLHPFDGAVCAGADSTTCATEGDMCCDVPPVASPNEECNTGRNSCTESYGGNAPDQTTNYMDYTEEYCSSTLTLNQSEIMQAVLSSSRFTLASASNINRTGVQCCHTSAVFDADKDLACLPVDTFRLNAIDSLGALYRWYISINDTVVFYLSDSNNICSFIPSQVGFYSIKLTVIANGDSVSFERKNYLEVADCNTPLTSGQATWAFGYFAGVKFTTGGVFRDEKPKKNSPNNIFAFEGSLSQCNTNGQMLFYAAGRSNNIPVLEMYNKEFEPLFNSSGMYGHSSASQLGVVLPMPGNGKRFYLIHSNPARSNPTDARTGLRYSVIDTTLDGGKGGVVDSLKNKPIKGPWFITLKSTDSSIVPGEGITAIPKCNGSDYWLIVQQGIPDVLYWSNTFQGLLVYSVTDTGIQYENYYPVTDTTINYGYLRASPDGKYLAGWGRVFSFDRETGTITGLVFVTAKRQTYGVSFSPDSRLVYMLSFDNTVNNPAQRRKLHQYNLISSDPFGTRKELATGSLFEDFALQIGPDNKIYGSGGNKLRVINFPNAKDTVENACGYTNDGPALSVGSQSTYSLPNMVDAKKLNELVDNFDVIPQSCLGVKVRSNIHCVNSYKWYFGDGDSAITKDASHTYTQKGNYTIQLVTPDTTITKTVSVGLTAIISGDTVFCGSTEDIDYSTTKKSEYIYKWQAISGTASILTVDNEYNCKVRWNTSGTLRLIIRNELNGCVDTSDKFILKIPTPIGNNIIGSDQTICDLSDVVQLSGNGANGATDTFTYEWRVKPHNGEWQNIPNSNDTVWTPHLISDSALYVRIAKSGGCEKASNLVTIKSLIKNNFIDIDTSDCDDIIGETPTNTTTYTYAWQRSIDSTNWTSIPSQTGKDLIGPVYFKKTHVRRLVQDSVCTSYSNVLSIQPSITSPITTTTDSFCYGETLLVTGSTPCSENSSITYQWQYKTSPSGDFGNIPVYYDSDNASLDEDWHFECELRRISMSAGDTMLSDTVAVYFKRLDNYIMSFEGFEPYRYAICSGSSAPGLEGSTICEYGAWGFAWESTTDTTDANSWQYEAGTPSFGPTVNTITKYYRRKAKHIALSDSTYTPAFQVYVRNPQITTQPGNATLNEGVNTAFHTVCLDLEPVKWQYGKVVGGSMVWTDLTAGEVITPSPTVPYEYSFDLVMPAELCLNGASFRAVYQNPCQSPGTYTYSNTVTLTVNAVSYDIWAKDYSTDVGGEPSTVSNTFIWDSPDIWNSRSTGITYHQNPEYRISDPNYIHAIVRNKGAATSIPAKLYLYWTFASTGERWDRHWLNDTTLSSTYGNWRTYYGAKKPLGGLIGVYNVPTITSGNSWQMEAAWYAPDPGVLTGDSNTTSAELCFLARIVTCSTPDYGLTYPETFYTRPNVERNNNLVTKNFIVVDSLAGNGKTHWNGNGNPTDVSATGRLVFTSRDCDYFEYGTVTVHLDNELQTLWVGNGANGSGFTLINDSTLLMDSCVMTLDDIAYGAETRSLYGIQFNERDDLIILENVDEYFEFDVQQYLTEESEENSIGGILYGVPVVLYPPETSGSQRRNTLVQDNKANQLAFSAFPNPFNDVLKVVYSLPKDESVTITLTNLLGQAIQTVEQKEFKTAGIHRLDINTANMTEGIYFITFKAGNEIKQKKIVLIR